MSFVDTKQSFWSEQARKALASFPLFIEFRQKQLSFGESFECRGGLAGI